MLIFFGKLMVYNALDQEEMHNSAFGSAPGRNARGALLENELSYDMFRLLRVVGAVLDCDAKGCYD